MSFLSLSNNTLSLASCVGVASAAYLLRQLRNKNKAALLSSMNQQKRDEIEVNPEKRKERRKAKSQAALESSYTTRCRRRNIVYEKDFGDVTIREYEEVYRCHGVPVVEGFPASGLCATLSANFLVDQLELPLIGELISESFPVLGVVSRFDASSGARLYGDERLVVFVTDFKLTDEDEDAQAIFRAVTEALYDFCERHQCPLLISVEGVPRKNKIDESDYNTQEEMLAAMLQQIDEKRGKGKGKAAAADEEDDDEEEDFEAEVDDDGTPIAKKKSKQEKKLEEYKQQVRDARKAKTEEEEKKKKAKKKKGEEESDDEDELKDGEVRFVCNDPNMALKLKSFGHQPLRDGLVSGVTGHIVATAHLQSTTVVCLFSPYDEVLTDVSTTVPIIQCISRLLGDVVLDMTDLERDVGKIEKEVRKALEGLVPGAKTKKDQHLSMYM